VLLNTTDDTLDLVIINRLDKAAFVQMLGDVFEHTRWIAERAYERRPFESVDALSEAMVQVVKESRRHEQFTLLRAHPQPAGKEAHACTLTA